MNRASERLPRRRDEARALFRNAILDAAESVFAQRGFHGARIQDIAEQAEEWLEAQGRPMKKGR